MHSIFTKIKEDRILTIPNALTLGRILLIPLCLYAYTIAHSRAQTILILLISGATDVLDGMIARRTNSASTLGKILDPLADKLTQLSLLYALMGDYPYLFMIAIPLSLKELVSGVAGLLRIRRTHRVESARIHGKLTTIAIYTTVMLHLLVENITPVLSLSLSLLSLGLLLYSFVLYMSVHLSPIENEARSAP